MIMKKIMLLVVGIMISTCVMGQTSTMEKYYAIKQMSDSLETLVDSYCMMVKHEPYDNIVMVDSLEKVISKVHSTLKSTKVAMYEMNETKMYYNGLKYGKVKPTEDDHLITSPSEYNIDQSIKKLKAHILIRREFDTDKLSLTQKSIIRKLIGNCDDRNTDFTKIDIICELRILYRNNKKKQKEMIKWVEDCSRKIDGILNLLNK